MSITRFDDVDVSTHMGPSRPCRLERALLALARTADGTLTTAVRPFSGRHVLNRQSQRRAVRACAPEHRDGGSSFPALQHHAIESALPTCRAARALRERAAACPRRNSNRGLGKRRQTRRATGEGLGATRSLQKKGLLLVARVLPGRLPDVGDVRSKNARLTCARGDPCAPACPS